MKQSNNITYDELDNFMRIFKGSFINRINEIILNRDYNIYFSLDGVETKKDFSRKIFYWVSRSVGKNHTISLKVRKSLLNSINLYLGTNFTIDDFLLIYDRLGNGVRPKLTEEFIDSNFDLALLKESEDEQKKQYNQK